MMKGMPVLVRVQDKEAYAAARDNCELRRASRFGQAEPGRWVNLCSLPHPVDPVTPQLVCCPASRSARIIRAIQHAEGKALRSNEDITRAIGQFADTVVRVCSLYFGFRPERDDAFQETFLKYAQSDKEFADDEHKKAWLISVATNVCKDMLKKAESKAVLLDRFEEAASIAGQPEPVRDDRVEELTEALQKLDEKYRVALYLKYFEGYKASEIAEMTGVPENTVYTYLARGREKLKEVLTNGRKR